MLSTIQKSVGLEEKADFIYKTKHYQYNVRSSVHSSDYLWDNIITILNQREIALIDNENDTNFSDKSIYDFISYLEEPNSGIISNENVYTFKLLNEKYKIKNLKMQIDEYIQEHKLELIILIILEKGSMTNEDIEAVVNRLFTFINNGHLLLLKIEFIDQILKYYRDKMPEDDIKNERILMNFFIDCLAHYGEPASILFKYVNFTKVGAECLSCIMQDYADTFNFKCIPNEVIKILCFSYAKAEPKVDEIEFDVQEGKEFEGIMRYLTNKTGCNIHDNGTIEITSNSIYNNSYHPKNLVDYGSESKFYQSDNISDGMINFDFKDRSIQLKSYAIKYHKYGQGCIYDIPNWVIEVSNDNSKWIEVNSHRDDSALNSQNCTAVFNVKSPQNQFYQYIRLRHTGNASSYVSGNCYFMAFQFIEFFGKLRQQLPPKEDIRFKTQKGNIEINNIYEEEAPDFKEEDIFTIMCQSNVSRSRAIEALREANGDLVTAVMNLAL